MLVSCCLVEQNRPHNDSFMLVIYITTMKELISHSLHTQKAITNSIHHENFANLPKLKYLTVN